MAALTRMTNERALANGRFWHEVRGLCQAMNAPSPDTTHSIEAEQAVLGALLINGDVIPKVADRVNAEDFFEPIHADLFKVAIDLSNAGKSVTPLTVVGFFDAAMQIGQLTLNQYVARLAAEAVTIVHAPDYAGIIRDHADKRRLASVASTLLDPAIIDPAKAAAAAIDDLDAVATSRQINLTPTVSSAESVTHALDAIAGAYQREGRISGVTWGLKDLDRKTLGMNAGQFILLAGRPGMGKTAVGLSVARAAAKAGHSVGIASLEMGDISLMTRMLADELFDRGHRVPYWTLSSGRFKEEVFEQAVDAGKYLSGLPITIDQRAGLTMAQIGAWARQQQRKFGLDLLIIDHLHLIRASDRYRGNKVNELGETSAAIKALAKDLGIPVLALAQLSRGVESREDKRPSLSDLRGSGDIEQDADAVIMLYREAYYLQRNAPPESDAQAHGEWLSKMEKAHNKLLALIEKQRNGPVGSVELFCDIAVNAVRDKAHQPSDPEPAPTSQEEMFT